MRDAIYKVVGSKRKSPEKGVRPERKSVKAEQDRRKTATCEVENLVTKFAVWDGAGNMLEPAEYGGPHVLTRKEDDVPELPNDPPGLEKQDPSPDTIRWL